MSRRSQTSSIAASPVFVGTVTLLVTVVAIFLAYNANAGLPFVPTYDLRASVPDAAGLIRGNEVRMGGARIGVVTRVSAEPGPGGRPLARLDLKLDKQVEPLRADSELRVRPRSPLGLKYLELTPGRRGRALPPGGELPVARGNATVELDEVLAAFDGATRRSLRATLDELAPALVTRGADLNATIAAAPPLLEHGERVAASLTGRGRPLRRLVRGAGAIARELGADPAAVAAIIDRGERTVAALARARDELGASVGELPATEDAGVAALAAATPVLEEAAALTRDLRAGTRPLPATLERLRTTVAAAIPALEATPGLAERLDGLLSSLERLAVDPATDATLRRLLRAVRVGEPTLEYLLPFQVRCNYLGLWFRNVPETLSEGDPSGTWFRTLTIQNLDEQLHRAEPSPTLHVNPYPHTGQNGECEAGNEGYAPGQAIGEAPGRQPGATEATAPPPGVVERAREAGLW